MITKPGKYTVVGWWMDTAEPFVQHIFASSASAAEETVRVMFIGGREEVCVAAVFLGHQEEVF